MPLLDINPAVAAEMLANPETFGLTLSVILEATIDASILWGGETGEPLDALTVFQELEHKYKVDLPEAVQNRIQAVMTLQVTEAYETDVLAFTGVTLAFTEGYLGDLVTGTLEELDSQAVLWSLFEAAAIDPYLRQLSPAVTQLVYANLAAPEDVEEAEEDPMMEFMDTLSQLREQLRALEMSQQLADQLIQRGLAALPDVDEQEQPPNH